MSKSHLLSLIIIIFIGSLLVFFNLSKPAALPLIAIANYGPHPSLEAAITGIKDALADQGYIENKNIRYKISDVGFESSLIPQMIAQLKQLKPCVMVVMTTPVAQYAKSAVTTIPLIYAVITDPVEAGLIQSPDQAYRNMTGSSDKQDLSALLQFTKSLIPQARRIGMLYASGEANDLALVNMMEKAAKRVNMTVVAKPIHQARDVPLVLDAFKNKVDFIYVGGSGPIQPTLPVIAAKSQKMGIPVFNLHAQAVKDGLVLASFGVDYHQVGANTGQLIADILKGIPLEKLKPRFPQLNEHQGCINKSKADALGLSIPSNLHQVDIVE